MFGPPPPPPPPPPLTADLEVINLFPVGPAGGMFYANDVLYESAVTPAHVPDRGPFDAFYIFPDCLGMCAPVSDSAAGDTDYNGGRWAVIAAYGIEVQLFNAEDVVAEADLLEDTEHRFVCPLIVVVP